MLTAVGAPLLVNVAVPSGTAGAELQLVPVVHSLPGPVQVASCAGPSSARKATPADHATRFHVEPRVDRTAPTDWTAYAPDTRSGTTRVAIPKTYSQEIVPWKNASGNHLAPLPRQTRAFDAACSDSSLWRRSGGRGLYKSILAISEGGPDAEMSFRLAARIAALFDGTVDAVHFAEHQSTTPTSPCNPCRSSSSCPTTG